MSKYYNFKAKAGCFIKGYVVADSKEEAIQKIKNGDVDDITDTELGIITDVDEIYDAGEAEED